MSVIEVVVERISQDISCEKEVVVLEVIDNHQPSVISVVQSIGESQSAVMSQKAVSGELFSLVSTLQGEIQNRIDANDALTSALQDEVQERSSADDALSVALQEEIQSRIEAGSTLSYVLQEEIQNRTDADNTLTSSLQAEIQDRIDADAILTSEIQRIQQEYNQALIYLKSQIDSDLSSLRSELLQHLRYSMYLNLPLGGTK